jgi:hypothetical protein
MSIKVTQSSPGITALATAPTALAVTFTPVATTVTAASATATTAQACSEKIALAPITHRRLPFSLYKGEGRAKRGDFIKTDRQNFLNRTNAERS